MKKKLIYRLFISLSLIGFLTIANSCTKEEKIDTNIHQEMVKVSDLKLDFDISRSSFEGVSDDTKAVKKDWEAGDEIHIIFKATRDMTFDSRGFLTLRFDGSNWSSSTTPADFTIPTSGNMSAIHVFKGKVPYFKTVIGPLAVDCDHSTYFLKDENKKYTVSDGVISEKLEMKLYDHALQITITNLKKEDGWNLHNENVDPTPGGTINCSSGQTESVKLAKYYPLLGIANEDGLAFYSVGDNNYGVSVGNIRLINKDGEVYNKKFDSKKFQNLKAYKITGPKSKTELNGWTFDSFKKDGVFYDFIDENSVQVSFNPQKKEGLDFGYNYSYSETVNIPATVEYDGKTYIVKKIGGFAFNNQRQVKTINIANGVTEIGAYAFTFCPNLETISLPATIGSIDYGDPVFNFSTKLSVTIVVENPYFESHTDGSIYDKSANKVLFWVPQILTGDLIIIDNCKSIKNYAINNSKVTYIHIPASVNNIGLDNFIDMPNLSTISLNWNATQLSALDYVTKSSGGTNIESFYFRGTTTNIIEISVPRFTKEAYKAHPLWGKGKFFTDEQIVERRK